MDMIANNGCYHKINSLGKIKIDCWYTETLLVLFKMGVLLPFENLISKMFGVYGCFIKNSWDILGPNLNGQKRNYLFIPAV